MKFEKKRLSRYPISSGYEKITNSFRSLECVQILFMIFIFHSSFSGRAGCEETC